MAAPFVLSVRATAASTLAGGRIRDLSRPAKRMPNNAFSVLVYNHTHSPATPSIDAIRSKSSNE